MKLIVQVLYTTGLKVEKPYMPLAEIKLETLWQRYKNYSFANLRISIAESLDVRQNFKASTGMLDTHQRMPA